MNICERLEVKPSCVEQWRSQKPEAVELLTAQILAEQRPRNETGWQPLPGMQIRDALRDLIIPEDQRCGLSQAMIKDVLREVAQFAYGKGYSEVSQLKIAETIEHDVSTVRRAMQAGEKVGVLDRLPRFRTEQRKYGSSPRSNIVVFHAAVPAGVASPRRETPTKSRPSGDAPVEPTPVKSSTSSEAPVEPTPAPSSSDGVPLQEAPVQGRRSAPRPSSRAPDIKQAPKSARTMIASGWCAEAAELLAELEQLPQLSPLANREEATVIWAAAAAATPPKPIDLVRKGLRELAAKVAGGVEEPSLERAIAFSLTARADHQRAAIPLEQPDDYLARLAREQRAAREKAEADAAQGLALAKQSPTQRAPAPNVFEKFLPGRRGRDPPTSS